MPAMPQLPMLITSSFSASSLARCSASSAECTCRAPESSSDNSLRALSSTWGWGGGAKCGVGVKTMETDDGQASS